MTITVFMFALILLSASYVVSFQNWMTLNSAALKGSNKQEVTNVYGAIGLRSIVSENYLPSRSSLISEKDILDNELAESAKKSTPIEFKASDAETGLDYRSYSTPYENQTGNENGLSAPNILINKPPSTLVTLDKSAPLVVELDNEVMVEFTADYSEREMQKALSRLLVQPNYLDADDLVSSAAIDTRLKPYLYAKALNQYKKPIRYPAQAFRYAEYLLINHRQKVEDEQGVFTVVTIPLTELQIPNSIKSYQAWVNEYAKKYKVSAELIFAIMHVESAFNPRAVSQSNALGLMQVKANAAGRDVYKLIDQRVGEPTQSELFNPKENIRVGTAYIGLLNNLYLKGIRNSENKELVAISSYNGGLSTVLKLFGNTPENAIKRINQLHPRQVYRTLRYSHQSDETKKYIEKVTQAKHRYKELLNLAA